MVAIKCGYDQHIIDLSTVIKAKFPDIYVNTTTHSEHFFEDPNFHLRTKILTPSFIGLRIKR